MSDNKQSKEWFQKSAKLDDGSECGAGSELASAAGSECEHDWQEEYYGTRCHKCDTFYAFGCEPWAPDDDGLSELQAINTIGDDLRDSGIEPGPDSIRCVSFRCDYAALIYLRVGESHQTRNGFLISKIDGWYCPVCAGGYGDFSPPPNNKERP